MSIIRNAPILLISIVHYNTGEIFFTITWIKDANFKMGFSIISEHQKVPMYKIVDTGKFAHPDPITKALFSLATLTLYVLPFGIVGLLQGSALRHWPQTLLAWSA